MFSKTFIGFRHNGCPSFLLDFSKDWQIASFFAFNKIQCSKNIAIYAFIDNDCGSTDANLIPVELESDVYRHQKQKSIYTVVLKEETNNGYVFKSFENLLNEPVSESWGYLFKFLIPVTERVKVLEELKGKSITFEKLFGTKMDDNSFDYTKTFFSKYL